MRAFPMTVLCFLLSTTSYSSNCPMRPFNISSSSTMGDVESLIGSGIRRLAIDACAFTNGTLVDLGQRVVCSKYRFEGTAYLANQSYAACVQAEHAESRSVCPMEDLAPSPFCGVGRSESLQACKSCHEGSTKTSLYTFYIMIWWRTCTWQTKSLDPPLCNAPLAIGHNFNGTCRTSMGERHCHTTSVQPAETGSGG